MTGMRFDDTEKLEGYIAMNEKARAFKAREVTSSITLTEVEKPGCTEADALWDQIEARAGACC